MGEAQMREIPVVKVNDAVNPIMAEFIIKNIEKAEKEGSEAIVIELDTPGGLDTSMRAIVKKILSWTFLANFWQEYYRIKLNQQYLWFGLYYNSSRLKIYKL